MGIAGFLDSFMGAGIGDLARQISGRDCGHAAIAGSIVGALRLYAEFLAGALNLHKAAAAQKQRAICALRVGGIVRHQDQRRMLLLCQFEQ